MKTHLIRTLSLIAFFTCLACAQAQTTIVATHVASAGYHSLFITDDGKLWSMGSNNYGQIGMSGTGNYRSPMQVTALDAESSINVATSSNHSLYFNSNGKLWAMGSNNYGQLGDGTTDNRNTPVQITAHGSSNVVAIATGNDHSLYVTSDGKLWAMGYNNLGQLGDGSSTNRKTPVQIAVEGDVIAVAAGASHSLFLTSDGKLWAMGYNYYGQFGDGTTINRTRPVKVQVPGTVIAVATNFYHSICITDDGKLWAMGYNDYGQLGDGTTDNRYTPVQITAHGSINVVAIATGQRHSLYVTSDGKLWAVGRNDKGQLGDGTTTSSRTIPVQIAVAGQVIAVAAGYSHSLFLTSDGKLWAMGDNSRGQLGDGTTSNHNTPVLVTMAIEPSFLPNGDLQAYTAAASGSVTLSVSATGRPLLAYQWQTIADTGTAWINIASATSSTLSFTNLTYSDNGKQYRVIASNEVGTIYSTPTTLTGVPLTWVSGYGSQTKQAGQTATFKANISADSLPLTYTWRKNGNLISGAIDATYTTPALATADNGSIFSVTATGPDGTASIDAALAVTPTHTLPGFASGGNLPPATNVIGSSTTLSISTTGYPAPAIQWQMSTNNGSSWSDVANATSASLALSGLTEASNGTQYRARLTNSTGTIYSNATMLLVQPAPPELSVSKIILSLAQNTGASASFTASGNVPWTAQVNPSSATWLALSPSNGAASITGTVTVSAASANTTGTPRSASAVVSGSGLVRTVIVTQRATAPAGAAPLTLAVGATLAFTFTDHDAAPGAPPETHAYTVIEGGRLTTTDENGTISIPYEYEATGNTGTLIFLDSVWSLNFANGAFRLYGFDDAGPYETDGAFTHTPPAPATYLLTVANGSGSGSYAAGATVTLTANTAPTGKVFDKWLTSAGGTFANANAATTTFTMPANATTVTATYKDQSTGGGNGNNNNGSGGGGATSLPAFALIAAPFTMRTLRKKV